MKDIEDYACTVNGIAQWALDQWREEKKTEGLVSKGYYEGRVASRMAGLAGILKIATGQDVVSNEKLVAKNIRETK